MFFYHLKFRAFINGQKVFVNEQFSATYLLDCGLSNRILTYY